MAVEEGADLDYFDLEDLGRLRRDVRRAIENVQRERELYHEIVLRYLKARLKPLDSLPRMPVPPWLHTHLISSANGSCTTRLYSST